MSFYNYYKILGVQTHAGADEIKAAFRELAVKYHPDKNPGNDQAEEVFKIISRAYDVLGDARKRQQYDQLFSLVLNGLQEKITQQEARLDRRKYGISRRIFKTPEQEVAEQIAGYERKVRQYSFFQRAVFYGVIMLSGWLLIFSHWFMDTSGIDFAFVFLGTVVFIGGSVGFFNVCFHEFHYRFIRHRITFDYEARVVWSFVLSLVAGGWLIVQVSEWRMDYHFKNYGVHVMADILGVTDTEIDYVFQTSKGPVYKRQSYSGDISLDYLPSKLPVIYSSENPKIARLQLPF